VALRRLVKVNLTGAATPFVGKMELALTVTGLEVVRRAQTLLVGMVVKQTLGLVGVVSLKSSPATLTTTLTCLFVTERSTLRPAASRTGRGSDRLTRKTVGDCSNIQVFLVCIGC
jgi:hypothetical protein